MPFEPPTLSNRTNVRIFFVTAALCLALAAAAGAGPAPGPGPAEASDPTASSSLADDALHDWAQRVHSATGSPFLRLRHLARLMARRNDFKIHRRHMATVAAGEAFRRGTGNCVSYAHLLVGAARAVGIPARFAVLDEAPRIVRRKGLRIEIHHMVVALSDEPRRVFDADGELRRAPVRILEDEHAAAILLSNRGVEALLAGRHRASVRSIRRALQLRPEDPHLDRNLRVALHRAATP